MNVPESQIITIRRPAQFGSGDRAYRVVIDGREAGTLGQGETCRIPVSAGLHTLQLKAGWCSSRRLQVELDQRPLTFDCGSNTHCDCLSEAIVKSRNYIWVRAAARPGGGTRDGTTA
jgi:hypothetical protein